MKHINLFALTGICALLLLGCGQQTDSLPATQAPAASTATEAASSSDAEPDTTAAESTASQEEKPLETVKLRAAIPESLWGAYAPAIDCLLYTSFFWPVLKPLSWIHTVRSAQSRT